MRRHPIQKVSSSGQVGSRLSLERFQSAGIIWNIIEIMAAASGGKKGGADWGVLFFIRHDTVPINPITRSPDPGVGFVSTDCVSSDGVDQAAAQRIRRWQSEQAASRTGRHARDLSVPECDKSHWRSKAVIDERWMSFRSKRMKHGPRDLHLLIQRNSIRCSLARYPLFGRVIGAGGGASPSMCGHATPSSRLTNHFLVGRSRSQYAKRPTGAASKCQSWIFPVRSVCACHQLGTKETVSWNMDGWPASIASSHYALANIGTVHISPARRYQYQATGELFMTVLGKQCESKRRSQRTQTGTHR